MSDSTFVLINAEKRAELYPDMFELGTRERREQMRVGMFVKLIFAELPARSGKQRSERAWVKIQARREDPLCYTGETIDDMFLDVDIGTEVSFGPEHICEWQTVAP